MKHPTPQPHVNSMTAISLHSLPNTYKEGKCLICTNQTLMNLGDCYTLLLDFKENNLFSSNLYLKLIHASKLIFHSSKGYESTYQGMLCYHIH